MERYSNAKIYRIEPICEHEEDEVYIGSTCMKYLSQRFSIHKQAYKEWQKNKKNNISSYRLFERYGFENCRIVLLEDFYCENKNQLLAREAYYQKSMKCVNKYVAFQSKEERKDYIKNYSENNKEQISEQKKIYWEHNKKQISEQQKIYYEQNKEKILEPMTCECGSVITKISYKRHCRSGKHQRLMSEQNAKI